MTPGPRKTLDGEQVAVVCLMIRDGFTQRQIARKFGVSNTTICDVWKHHRRPGEPSSYAVANLHTRLSPEERDAIGRRALEGGRGVGLQLSKEYNISTSWVSRLKSQFIKKLSTGEAELGRN